MSDVLPRTSMSQATRRALSSQEHELWTRAGALWTDELMLREPTMLDTKEAARLYHAETTLACINAMTFETLFNLDYMRQEGVEGYLYAFMAHEIGHHVIAPAGFTNHMRYLAAAMRSTSCAEPHGYINLALDLLLNTILYREHDLPVDEIYRTMCGDEQLEDVAFGLMLDATARLWGCRPMHGGYAFDFAQREVMVSALCAVYTIHAEGRRGLDLVPYVALASRLFALANRQNSLEDQNDKRFTQGGFDVIVLHGEGDERALREWLRSGGLQAMERASGQAEALLDAQTNDLLSGEPSPGLYLPELVQRALHGLSAGELQSPTEIVVSHYETIANAHLVEFVKERGGHAEPYPESLKPWTIGDPLEEVDWLQSAIRGGVPIPDVHTVSWDYGSDPEPGGMEPFPVDLDLYVDTSGSMPDPLSSMSHIALGAFIFALSVLRQGGAVRVTIWSYNEEHLLSTNAFSTSREEILSMLCHSIRGGTQFPVEHWARALKERTQRANLVHTVILSDDGIDTWYGGRAFRTSRVEAIMEERQRAFGAGGTVILNGPAESIDHPLPSDWSVHGCLTWEEVVEACAEVARTQFIEHARHTR